MFTSDVPPRIRALAKVIHDNDLSLFPSIFNKSDGTLDDRAFDGNNAAAGGAMSSIEAHTKAAIAARRASRRKSIEHHTRVSFAAAGGGAGAAAVDLSSIDTGDLDVYNRRALSALLGRLQDGHGLGHEELVLFEQAFRAYSQHLRVVDSATLNASRYGAVLRITMAIDSESTYAGVALGDLLPAVIRSHDLCLKHAHDDILATMSVYHQTMVETLCSVLEDILCEVNRNSESRCGSLPGTTSPESRLVLADLNSVLDMHVIQLEWLIASTTNLLHFDIFDHISDLSCRDSWVQFIGQHTPMCGATKFSALLQVFPQWAQSRMMEVLNVHDCGFVSVWSLKRLLALWGPFLLLDRNMFRDLSTGMFTLRGTTVACEEALVKADDKQAGDYGISMSRAVACFNVTVITPSGRLQTIVADRTSGAWMLRGVSMEDYATVAGAIESFPQLFIRPRGVTQVAAGDSQSDSQQQQQQKSDVANGDSFSIFHRACFHNNVQYVRTLIERGATVLVNTAVADPLITSRYSWTPMLCAVNNPNGDPDEVVRMLISCGAHLGITDEASCTALYYAIANGYPKTVALLLQSDATLASSASTHPLMCALGAHHFNTDDADNHRLCATLPCPAVVIEILRYVKDWNLVRLAIALIETKISGITLSQEDVKACSLFPHLCWSDLPKMCRDSFVLMTKEERDANERAICEHDALCKKNKLEVSHVLRLLRMHGFKLSCHAMFGL